MTLTPHEVFAGRYRLISEIGKGGFSVVWLALDQLADDMECAIKIYAPDKGLDQNGLKQFRKEYTLTVKLNHQNLLKANHFDVHNGSPFLIMPFCRNGSLASKLADGNFSEQDIAHVVQQCAAALAYMHEEQILHQDIKPDNVLINDRNQYLLTDFGISSRMKSTLGKATNSVGSAMTIAYAAPERFNARQESLPEGDVFSLGVMIYELAKGDVPWMARGGSVLTPETELPEMPQGYSRGLSDIVRRCLDYHPERRPSAKALSDAATHFLQKGTWKIASAGGGRVTETLDVHARAAQPRQTEPQVPREQYAQRAHEPRREERRPQEPQRNDAWNSDWKKQETTSRRDESVKISKSVAITVLAIIVLIAGFFTVRAVLGYMENSNITGAIQLVRKGRVKEGKQALTTLLSSVTDPEKMKMIEDELKSIRKQEENDVLKLWGHFTDLYNENRLLEANEYLLKIEEIGTEGMPIDNQLIQVFKTKHVKDKLVYDGAISNGEKAYGDLKFDQAIASFKQALQLNRNAPEVAQKLSQIEKEKQSYSACFAKLADANELFNFCAPTDACFREAMDAYEQILKACPKMKQASDNLKIMKDKLGN